MTVERFVRNSNRPGGGRPPYRHSRVSGNPDGTDKDRPTIHRAFRDSRLRGNDGRGRRGRTVEAAGKGGKAGCPVYAIARNCPKPAKRISENKEYKQKIILPCLLIDKTLLPMYKFPQYLRIPCVARIGRGSPAATPPSAKGRMARPGGYQIHTLGRVV